MYDVRGCASGQRGVSGGATVMVIVSLLTWVCNEDIEKHPIYRRK